MDLLSAIEPLQFNFKATPYLALPNGNQYGVIAQKLEGVLPDLVSDITFPEVKDDQGNSLHPVQTYKGVNYTGLVPITIQAVKDLNEIVSNATLSDNQLKQNVQPLQNALDLVCQLDGVSYEWDQSADSTLTLPLGVEHGLIAQDVEAIIPEVIFMDAKGYKHVEYQKLVPHLIEANKQLKDSLTGLQSQLASLSQQVNDIQSCIDNIGLCNNSSAKVVQPNNNSIGAIHEPTEKVSLESIDNAILYQNEPNPFSEVTVIRYYLPENVKEATLIFHDEYGRVLNEQILSNGSSQMEVDSERLAAGVYTYSLIVDGDIIETKKMIKVRN